MSGTEGNKKGETPYSLFFEKLKVVENEHGMLGHMLIKGISEEGDEDDRMRDHDDDDDEETEEDKDKYTQEQMDSIRLVLINQKRSDMLDEMREFILGDQADDGIMMFNTSFSYEIQNSYNVIKRIRDRKRSWGDKFDLLFAYTYMIKEFDVWMHDNEGGMNDMVLGLARMWKNTLKKSNEELGIDQEYTRPGVEEFLEDFKTAIEDAYAEPPFQFNYC